jgi:serine/threonine protein kinase
MKKMNLGLAACPLSSHIEINGLNPRTAYTPIYQQVADTMPNHHKDHPKLTTEEKAQKVWDASEDALTQLDAAHVFSVAKQACRDFPQFDAKEITQGSLLGKGGFSNVFEVVGIHIFEEESKPVQEEKATESPNASVKKSPKFTLPTATGPGASAADDEEHYDVAMARKLMSQRCLRFGSARYAVKRLRPDLDQLKYARGVLDLAIEIKFMSVLLHPNIVKMRAYSNTPRLSLDTFIVMDRLYGTLDEKMELWIQTDAMLKGCCGLSKDAAAEKQFFRERMLIAYDLTVALEYMHSLRLIYRDIKPENIGFDVRGDVKVFDFGLMKSLDQRNKAKHGTYGYHLTAFTGSIPYMAPEVALKEPYDKEADVFSFSMLLWEIVSVEVLYPDYSIKEYFFRVCKNNERPPLAGNAKRWPAILKAVIQEGWNRNPQQRPTMKRFGMLIRGLLHDIASGDESIENRTQHMLNKSRRSLHNTVSVGQTDDADNNPMMNNSDGRRSGRRSDRKQKSGISTTAAKTLSSVRTPRRSESFHQNFDPETLIGGNAS